MNHKEQNQKANDVAVVKVYRVYKPLKADTTQQPTINVVSKTVSPLQNLKATDASIDNNYCGI